MSPAKVVPVGPLVDEEAGLGADEPYWGAAASWEWGLRRALLPVHLVLYAAVVLPIGAATTLRSCFREFNAAQAIVVTPLLFLFVWPFVYIPGDILHLLVDAFLPARLQRIRFPFEMGPLGSMLWLVLWPDSAPAWSAGSPWIPWILIVFFGMPLPQNPHHFANSSGYGNLGPGFREFWRWRRSADAGTNPPSAYEDEGAATLLYAAASANAIGVRAFLRAAMGGAAFRKRLLSKEERRSMGFNVAAENSMLNCARDGEFDEPNSFCGYLCVHSVLGMLRRNPHRIRVEARSADHGDGRTVLMWAARHGCLPAVERLINGHGADVHAVDALGWTALHHAAEKDERACVQALLELGASPAATAFDGRTPFEVSPNHCGAQGALERAMQRWDTETLKLLCSESSTLEVVETLYKVLPQYASKTTRPWVVRSQMFKNDEYDLESAKVLSAKLIQPLLQKTGDQTISSEGKPVLKHVLSSLKTTGLVGRLDGLQATATEGMQALQTSLHDLYSGLKTLPHLRDHADCPLGRAREDERALLQTAHMPELPWLDKEGGVLRKSEEQMAAALLEAGAFASTTDFCTFVCEVNASLQSTGGTAQGLKNKASVTALRQAVSKQALPRLLIARAVSLLPHLNACATELFGKGCVVIAPPKGITRVLVKQREHWDEHKYHAGAAIRDYARFSVWCANEDDMLRERKKLLDPPPEWFEPLREKNGFHHSVDENETHGYRDLKILGVFTPPGLKDGDGNQVRQIIEVQLLINSFLAIKKYQHLLYELSRGDFNARKA